MSSDIADGLIQTYESLLVDHAKSAVNAFVGAEQYAVSGMEKGRGDFVILRTPRGHKVVAMASAIHLSIVPQGQG